MILSAEKVGKTKMKHLREYMEGEYLPREKTAANKMASELLGAAKGDRDTAEKMAHGFLFNLVRAIDKQAEMSGMKDAGRGRPEQSRPQHNRAKGYDQPDAGQSTFSDFA